MNAAIILADFMKITRGFAIQNAIVARMPLIGDKEAPILVSESESE
jgi:hypothetical protein